MAGGSGTRLWPASRKNQPKQLLGLIGKKTLLQNTFARLAKGFLPNQIFVATHKNYARQIQKQLSLIPKANYSLEPETLDRGPALGLAALVMLKKNPQATFVTAWSDHYIKNERTYFKAIKTAKNFLRHNPKTLLCIGVKPAFPHTGLGYIKLGSRLGKNSRVFHVISFTEKPDSKTARKFLHSGRYLWNTGYFACRADFLLELYKKHLPEIYSLLMKIKPFIGTQKQQLAINKYYPQMPEADIERGLVEKTQGLACIKADFDWVDIGSWKVVKEILSGKNKNLISGLAQSLDTQNCLIYNYEPKLVTAVGLKNLAIINTKDTLLVADLNSSEKVKELVKKLGGIKQLKRYL